MLSSYIKIALIDNDDSFTYNLVQLIEQAGVNVEVISHDKVTIAKIENFEKIILSPGPDLPSNYKNLNLILKNFYTCKSILGVCLGHQSIAEFFGCKLINLTKPYHGIKSKIELNQNDKLFKNLPATIEVGRYHSWVVENHTIPEDILITATDENNHIMAIAHKYFDVRGVQFHPESFMTETGNIIIQNWLED